MKIKLNTHKKRFRGGAYELEIQLFLSGQNYSEWFIEQADKGIEFELYEIYYKFYSILIGIDIR